MESWESEGQSESESDWFSGTHWEPVGFPHIGNSHHLPWATIAKHMVLENVLGRYLPLHVGPWRIMISLFTP